MKKSVVPVTEIRSLTDEVIFKPSMIQGSDAIPSPDDATAPNSALEVIKIGALGISACGNIVCF